MARAMNVTKRKKALGAILKKLDSYAVRAQNIAEAIEKSFEGNTSSKAKEALKVAKAAWRIATNLDKAIDRSLF